MKPTLTGCDVEYIIETLEGRIENAQYESQDHGFSTQDEQDQCTDIINKLKE